ncbi:hypothetical protein CRYUN_Cryun22dG0032300 [Craigia yunnanensis]
MWIRVQKLLGIYEILEKHLNVDYQDVDDKLRELIFQQLKERSNNINNLFDIKSCKELLNCRGDCVLEKTECLELLKWSTIDVEFDHSLLLRQLPPNFVIMNILRTRLLAVLILMDIAESVYVYPIT